MKATLFHEMYFSVGFFSIKIGREKLFSICENGNAITIPLRILAFFTLITVATKQNGAILIKHVSSVILCMLIDCLSAKGSEPYIRVVVVIDPSQFDSFFFAFLFLHCYYM